MRTLSLADLCPPSTAALGAVLSVGRRREVLPPPPPESVTREERVLARDLAFVTRLTNPCQVALTGALLPRVRPQPGQPEQQRAEELAIELHRAGTLAGELRQLAVRQWRAVGR